MSSILCSDHRDAEEASVHMITKEEDKDYTHEPARALYLLSGLDALSSLCFKKHSPEQEDFWDLSSIIRRPINIPRHGAA